MNISIHKFGGASVKNADAVKNIAEILKSFPSDMSSIIVVSAMGKTTNKLEKVSSELNDAKAKLAIDKIAASHVEIANSLELSGKFVDEIWSLFSIQNHITDIDERYDATVSLGELASTRIISEQILGDNGS